MVPVDPVDPVGNAVSAALPVAVAPASAVLQGAVDLPMGREDRNAHNALNDPSPMIRRGQPRRINH